MTFRPMPILTLFSLVSLVILVLLGNWQYERYTAKMAQGPADEAEFSETEVVIDRANPGNAQQVYGIIEGEAVWRRYVPGRLEGSDELVLVLWDATSGTEPVPLAIADTGPYLRRANVFDRPQNTGGMMGSNRPEENLWYRFDATGMLERLGYDQSEARVVESDTLTMRLSSDLSRVRRTTNPYASATLRDPLPPERHFGYALTWWGMALALIAIYVAFHRAQGRLKFRK